jgi:hypothetical protein
VSLSVVPVPVPTFGAAAFDLTGAFAAVAGAALGFESIKAVRAGAGCSDSFFPVMLIAPLHLVNACCASFLNHSINCLELLSVHVAAASSSKQQQAALLGLVPWIFKKKVHAWPSQNELYISFNFSALLPYRGLNGNTGQRLMVS